MNVSPAPAGCSRRPRANQRISPARATCPVRHTSHSCAARMRTRWAAKGSATWPMRCVADTWRDHDNNSDTWTTSRSLTSSHRSSQRRQAYPIRAHSLASPRSASARTSWETPVYRASPRRSPTRPRRDWPRSRSASTRFARSDRSPPRSATAARHLWRCCGSAVTGLAMVGARRLPRVCVACRT